MYALYRFTPILIFIIGLFYLFTQDLFFGLAIIVSASIIVFVLFGLTTKGQEKYGNVFNSEEIARPKK